MLTMKFFVLYVHIRWACLINGNSLGGKTAHEASQREILEELDCKIATNEIICEHTHEYDTFTIHLHVIKAAIKEGTPKATEHAKLVWLALEHLDSVVWAPADIPAVEKIMKTKTSSP